MADTSDVARLFGALKSAGSPLQRMKLLARAWRTIRGLSPRQRAHLASTVGLEGAEELLERLADRGNRLSPAFLLQALDKIKSADPRELQNTVNGLRDPERRGKILERGLDRLTDTLVGDDRESETRATTPQQAHPPEPERAAAPDQTPRVRPTVKPTVTAAAVTAGVAAGAAAKKASPGATARKVSPATATTKVPSAPAPRPSATPSKPRTSVPPTVRATPEPAPDEAAARRSSTSGAAAPERTTSTDANAASTSSGRADSAAPLNERLAGVDGLMDRFRILHRHVDTGRGLSTDQLRSLLDGFPPGWAQRRALCALLRAGIPGDLHQAIFLVETLESPTDRRWCVAAILRSFELSDFEKQTLLVRHGSYVRSPVADAENVLG